MAEEKKVELKTYLKYTCLNILGMIGLSCYILADTFFVSKGLGTNGLAALNFAIPVYNLINGAGLMFAMGGASMYSLLAHQNKEKGNEIFSHAVFGVVCFAILFMFVGIFGAGRLAALLGASGTVHGMTQTYIRVVLLFSPAFMMNNVLIGFGRNEGRPELAMLAMLCGSIFNIIFDYIFIFPMKMGILGAVLATGFSPIVGMSIMLTHYLSKKSNIKLSRVKIRGKIIGRICSIGTGSLITEVSAGIVMIIFNYLMLEKEGNTGVAAYGVIANISLVVIAIFNGMSQGLQPLVSKAYGSGDGAKARKYLKYAVGNVLILGTLIYGAIFLGANPIARIFNSENNEKLQVLAVEGLKLYFIATVFVGLNIILSIYFSAAGKETKGQMIAILRGFVLIIPLAFVMSAILGVTGIWLTLFMTELFTFLTAVMVQIFGSRRSMNRM